MKKLTITLAVIGVLIIGIVLGNNEKFFGQLVFFKNAPVKEKVIEGAYLKVKDAFFLLMNATTKAGITNKTKFQNIAKEWDALSETQITRAQFADLAVQIFGIKEFGYGINFSDIGDSSKLSKTIYLFTESGGMDAEFKPDNPATRAFGEKAAENLARRFANTPERSGGAKNY